MDKIRFDVETGGEVIEFTRTVIKGQNILEFGYTFLQEILTLKAGTTIPVKTARKTYNIVGITILEHCEGCVLNMGGQRSHMECPDGCLHDKEGCDFC